MMTLEYITSHFKKERKRYKLEGEALENAAYQQRLEEAKIIESDNDYSRIAGRYVSANNARRALMEKHDDPTVLKVIMWFNNSLDTFPENPAGITSSYNIRNYFPYVELMKSHIGDNHIMKAKITSDTSPLPPVYIIKTVMEEDLYHEYFVTAFGTNTLRDRIPNFAYMLGKFRCTPPHKNKDNVILTWCNEDKDKLTHIIYERVTDSVNMYKFLSICSFEEFLNIFVQITLSLQIAYEEFDFTHYDLHLGNVLIKVLPEEILISYPGGYLKTRYIAVIIDFETAHIKWKGESFGYTMIEHGVRSDKSFPIFDIFKFFMYSLYTSLDKNKEVLTQALPMALWFNEKLDISNEADVKKYILTVKELFCALPYSEELDVAPTEFFHYITDLYPDILMKFFSQDRWKWPNLETFGCANNNTGLSEDAAIDKYTSLAVDHFSDPVIFYRLYMENVNREEVIKPMKRLGSYYLTEWSVNLLKAVKALYIRILHLTMPDVEGIDKDMKISICELSNNIFYKVSLAEALFEIYPEYKHPYVNYLDNMKKIRALVREEVKSIAME